MATDAMGIPVKPTSTDESHVLGQPPQQTMGVVPGRAGRAQVQPELDEVVTKTSYKHKRGSFEPRNFGPRTDGLI